MLKTSLYACILFSMMISSCNNYSCKRSVIGKGNAKNLLRTALSNYQDSIAVSNVTDSPTFVAAIEPILFDKYNKEQILNEKPYEIYHLDAYWVAFGTLPEGFHGGVFEIVVDSQKKKAIYISHSK